MNKPGFLVVLLSLLWAVAGFSQPFRSGLPGTPVHTEVLPFADHLTVAFLHPNAVEILVFDPGMRLRYEKTVPDLGLAPDARFLGLSEEDKGWHLYYQSQGSLVTVPVPMVGEPSVQRLEGYGNLSFNGSFSFNGTMHLIRMSAWDNEIRLVKFREGRQVFSESFPISFPRFVSRAGGSFQKMGEEAFDLSTSHPLAKWYRFGDRLVFTLDEAGATEMLELDLLSSVMTEHRFSWEGLPALSSNSLCLGNYLSHVSREEAALRIRVVRFDPKIDIPIMHLLVTPEQGVTEELMAPGWSASQYQAYVAEPGQAPQLQQDRNAFFAELSGNPLTGLACLPQEQGWLIQAGSLEQLPTYGTTGMVVDEAYRMAWLSFQVKLAEGEDQQTYPLVFSSLRSDNQTFPFIWNGQRRMLSRDRQGRVEIW